MRLSKHHGLGNDFLVHFDLDGTRPVGADVARAVCDRHRGVGADGFIRVTRAADALVMHLFNADGGRAEMSGNGISCLAQAAVVHGVVPAGTVRVHTDAGPRTVVIEPTADAHVHRATVDMGSAKVGDDEPEWTGGDVLRAAHVDIGNPHLVLHAAAVDAVDIESRGIEVNEVVPGGINVEVVEAGPGDGELTMHVYERGVGLTEACGTGACATAAAAHQWELIGHRVRVHQPGGAADIVLGETIRMTVPVVHIATIEYHA